MVFIPDRKLETGNVSSCFTFDWECNKLDIELHVRTLSDLPNKFDGLYASLYACRHLARKKGLMSPSTSVIDTSVVADDCYDYEYFCNPIIHIL